MISIEVKTVDCFFHIGFYFIITQIADAAFMYMLHMGGIRKIIGFNIHPYFFIRVAEWCAVQHQLVHFFHTKEIPVLIILQNVFFHFHMA